nr:hypothetical protein [Kribbella italica]
MAVGFPVLAIWQILAHKLRDRADVVIVLVTGIVFLLFARASANWNSLPPWLWLVGVALMAVATALSGRIWAGLAWFTAERPRRALSAVLQLLLAGAVCAVLL